MISSIKYQEKILESIIFAIYKELLIQNQSDRLWLKASNLIIEKKSFKDLDILTRYLYVLFENTIFQNK